MGTRSHLDDDSVGDAFVPCTKKSGTTGLTETQARALADWWGGRYQQVSSPGRAGKTRHAAIFQSPGQEKQGTLIPRDIVVFSLEEARILEKFREAINPGAPDWVG